MRVIAGTHGGRRLRAPDTDDTRPVTDRAKESIFSSLGETVRGARVLDLYAGAGSFGIEALSRGADSAVFVESGSKALRALRHNLETLGLSAEVVSSSVERYVAGDAGPFDLVFCDPPWPLPAASLSSVLDAVTRFVAEDGLVVVTRRASDEIPEPVGLAIADERRLGDTRIMRYVRKTR